MSTKNGKSNALSALKRTTIDLDALLGSPKEDNKLYADWADIEPGVIANFVWAFVEMGGTVQFGRTKNCRAFVLKPYVGKAYDPIYFDGSPEGRAAMAELSAALVESVAGSS